MRIGEFVAFLALAGACFWAAFAFAVSGMFLGAGLWAFAFAGCIVAAVEVINDRH